MTDRRHFRKLDDQQQPDVSSRCPSPSHQHESWTAMTSSAGNVYTDNVYLQSMQSFDWRGSDARYQQSQAEDAPYTDNTHLQSMQASDGQETDPQGNVQYQQSQAEDAPHAYIIDMSSGNPEIAWKHIIDLKTHFRNFKQAAGKIEALSDKQDYQQSLDVLETTVSA